MFKRPFGKTLQKTIRKAIKVPSKKIVVFAKAQSGAVMSFGRYTTSRNTKVQQISKYNKINELITKHFNDMSSKGEPWSSLVYIEQNGSFHIDYAYEEDISEDFDVLSLMNSVLVEYFPGLEIEPASFS